MHIPNRFKWIEPTNADEYAVIPMQSLLNEMNNQNPKQTSNRC